MSDVIGQILSFAVGVAISPVPIIAVVLMLATPRGQLNGPAFLAGWMFGLLLAGTVILLLAGGAGASEGGEPSSWVGWLKLLLGLALLALAVRQWRGRPAGGEAPELSSWMKRMDSFKPGRAFALAFALAAINPKNLLLTVGAAAAIAQAGVDAGEQAVALAVFAIIATLGVGAPVVIRLTVGERSVQMLAALRDWMGAHNPAIMTVLFLVLGAKLVGDGIVTL
jgi:threonine/homoserine/homoserine lactone efflux protein